MATQLTGSHPLYPRQFHVHGPAPATALACHLEQRLIVGAVVTLLLCAVPQVALIVRRPLQFVFVPPLYPLHVQESAPEAVSATVPAAHSPQRPVVGMVPTVVPATVPQVAFILLRAKQLLEFQKLSQAQTHEILPVLLVATTPGVPGAQSFLVSIVVVTVVHESAPQAALIGLFA